MKLVTSPRYARFFSMLVMVLEREHTLWQMRSQYYEALDENQKQVRRLRHDMANHLQTLAALDGEESKDYLRQLIEMPAITGGQRFCENVVVNTVLGAKSALWEEAGIVAELKVHLPKDLPFADVDLASLFANCLDNAIEANRKLEPGQRTFRLVAKTTKGVFLLREENPLKELPQMQSGRIQTSKKDSKDHGFGLWGIEEISRRYGGTATASAEEGKFVLMVSIPCGAKE
ncbi:ATP-binding protein [Ruminococcaceae bacterium OttesenSCG-928-I18]|nr:ATP-binding protein [Ruminococcaceae bacterium OttesenSCG-928-I18]